MKKCPFCAEDIQDGAIVCKHCRRDLPKADVAVTPTPKTTQASPSTAAAEEASESAGANPSSTVRPQSKATRRAVGGVLALVGFLFTLAGISAALVGILLLWVGFALVFGGHFILRWGGSFVAAIVLGACGASIGSVSRLDPRSIDSLSRRSRPDSSAGTTATRSRSTESTPRYASFGSGTKVVGSDIQPGTYRTRKRAPGCYWARLSGFSGEIGDLIANGNESGPTIVTISPSDKGFESHRCGAWTADLSAMTVSQNSPFSDGIFIVGTDIAPGTWRADAPESCYWARLRGFSGAMGDLIANDNGNGIVSISRSDTGFSSTRCGTWAKVE